MNILTNNADPDELSHTVAAHLGLHCLLGAQWLSGRVLDSRPKGGGFEPHRRHCVVSLSKNINPSLVLVQPRNTRPFITERLLMEWDVKNQIKQRKKTLLARIKIFRNSKKKQVFRQEKVIYYHKHRIWEQY